MTAFKQTMLLGFLVSILLITPQNAEAVIFGSKDKNEDAPAQIKTDRPESFADLAEDLIPTVVNISSTVSLSPAEDLQDIVPQFPEGSPFEDFFERFMERRGDQGGRAMPSSSLGSGFIVDAENGYIITNNHVVKDAEEVRVTLHNEETVEAEIIGRDEKTDLAVLKIDPKGKTLKAANFGNSDDIRVGDWILAIGNPFGLGGTVTAGIISARARDINSGPYDDYLQTDASINRGNSGGPMFDLDGNVIGINTAIFSPTGGSVGIGFAIPSTLAEPIIDQLIEFGRTRRGWLGVRIQTVTDEIAESLGLESARGALVASVTKGGPAEEAGIEAGDIILEFDEKPIDEMRALPRIVAETKIGTDTKVLVLNKGKEKTVTVKIGELEKAEEEGLLDTAGTSAPQFGTELGSLGVSIEDLNDQRRDEYAVDDSVSTGVLIVDVDPQSEAGEKGLIAGDVIVEINQTPLTDTNAAMKAVEDAQAKERSSVLLLINRGGDVRFIALKIDGDAE